jgi:hypothetical protein
LHRQPSPARSELKLLGGAEVRATGCRPSGTVVEVHTAGCEQSNAVVEGRATGRGRRLARPGGEKNRYGRLAWTSPGSRK